MPWVVLIVSAVLEAVWATALGQTEQFTRFAPTVVFLIAIVFSMAGLGWAARWIPIGTAYAVWTGLGAALTVGYAMWTGAEAVSAVKVLFLAGIIAAVAGLRWLPPQSPARRVVTGRAGGVSGSA
ncbi:multidrug efflux SMR transporter [Mycobacterium sp. SMC-4]|uniref:DMT family transporter n=1 Tax=Mycobacterium sp. SMC-4 TaxID=2857059 RepID=UPI0021B423CF|nr:multidrug efflux SMR transporter [Mycobacterium sp. SMC-4]UXA21031.1 multidrug efflux SMR transporter [Mycobacterium sp. SMC-4]